MTRVRGSVKTRDLYRDTEGQAASEYAILVFWTVVLSLTAIRALDAALLDFYWDITTLLCLPVP